MKKIIKQIFKFGISGILNYIISLLVYYIIVFINEQLYLFGNILGFLVSILNAYFMNKYFVFKNKQEDKNNIQLLKTYIMYIGSLGLSLLILYISVEYLHISKIIAPFIYLMITAPLNFLVAKFWIYR